MGGTIHYAAVRLNERKIGRDDTFERSAVFVLKRATPRIFERKNPIFVRERYIGC